MLAVGLAALLLGPFEDGLSPEILQMKMVGTLLLATTVVAVVALRQRDDPTWSRISLIAGTALIIEVVATVIWLMVVFAPRLPA